jgi:hypothetical protein
MTPDYTNNTATFDPSLKYRYTLKRQWALPLGAKEDRGTCMFLMLNPSTADASKDDPTIRRCVGFAQDWGFSGLLVTNLFALRSTDPDQLYVTPEPIGLGNDEVIVGAAKDCGLVIAAWGTHGAFMNRGAQVLALLEKHNRPVHHLGLTAGGHPKHPLYLPKTAKSVPFVPGKVSIK